MLVSFVLRIDADRAAEGALVGQVEDVASGAAAAVRSVGDLIAFCASRATRPPVTPREKP